MKKRRGMRRLKSLLCILVAVMIMAGLVTRPFANEMETAQQSDENVQSDEPMITITEEQEVAEPEVTEPEVTEPEVTEPEVTEPEVTEPEVTEPEVPEPEVPEPEVTEPEITEPEATQPEESLSQAAESEVVEEDISPMSISGQTIQIQFVENGGGGTKDPQFTNMSSLSVAVYVSDSKTGSYTLSETLTLNRISQWYAQFQRDNTKWYKLEAASTPEGYSLSYIGYYFGADANLIPPGSVSQIPTVLYTYPAVVPQEKKVTEIYVSKKATKTKYTTDEAFDPAGAEVTAVYDDGSEAVVNGWTYEPSTTLTTVGKQKITFSYTDPVTGKAYTDWYNVTVTQGAGTTKTLTGIAITTPPTKTSYQEGDVFDKTGMVVKATYSDSTEADVTSSCVITPNRALTVADNAMMVSYTEGGVTKSVTQTVTVSKREAVMTALEVKTPPNKISYVAGQNLDLTGMVVIAKFDDNTEEDVTSLCSYVPTAGTALTTANTSIAIAYTKNGVSKTTSQSITVAAKTLTAVTVEGTPTKTSYVTGESFAPAGLTMKAQYNDGTSEVITAEACTITPDPLTKGTTAVTISYTKGGVTKSASYTGIVVEDEAYSFDRLEVTTPPTKVAYIEGETFNSSGMVVTAVLKSSKNEKREIVTDLCTYVPDATTNLTTSNSSIQISCTLDGTTKTTNQSITVRARELTGIRLEGSASKMTYTDGESFNPNGITVYAEYDNGTSSVLTASQYTITPATLSTGDTSVTFQYGEKTAVYNGITVNAVPVVLQSIRMENAPGKTTYTEGQSFDTSGMQVMAVYSDGSERDVTAQCTITPNRALTTADTFVTVTYTDGSVSKEVRIPITVTASVAVLDRIEVTTNPTKQNYIQGQKFDPTGMVVTAFYNDASTLDVTSQCTLTPDINTALAVSNSHINISYTENNITKSATTAITVAAKVMTGIHTEGTPSKVNYQDGDQFEPQGLSVYADYNDGTKEEVAIASVTITPDPLTTGTTGVTLAYNGFQTTYVGILVSSVPVTLEKIQITQAPTKTAYVEGQQFDPAGMIVTAVYSNGGTAVVTDSVRFSPDISEALATSDTVIQVRYTEGEVTKTADQSITVAAKILTGIRTTGTADKLVYIQGETFDATGLTIRAVYNDGTELEIPAAACIIAPNPLNAGDTSVTITYQGKSVVYTGITVNEPEAPVVLDSLAITQVPTKTAYVEGQFFDKTGLEVNAIYSDGTRKNVTEKVTYQPGLTQALTVSDTQMSISYEEKGLTKSVTQAITVEEKALTSLRLDGTPTKLSYVDGDSFDSTGMTVTAIYNDGNEVILSNTQYTVTPNPLTEGVTGVTISYTDGAQTKTVDFDGITVTGAQTPAVLTGITVATQPTKIDYLAGQFFDAAGLVVMAQYDDGSEREVTGLCSFLPQRALETGDTTVTVQYTDGTITRTADITVSVTEPEAVLTRIEVTQNAAKTAYIEGQKFDPTGLIITAYYDDGTSLDVTNMCTLVPDEQTALTAGLTQIAAAYTDGEVTVNTNIPITVVAKAVTGIHLEGTAAQLVYVDGDTFDPTGITIYKDYNDGTKEVVNPASCQITPDPLTEGTTQVGITYNGHTATYGPIAVNAVPLTLDRIEITQDADKTNYVEGQTFDKTGMIVKAYFSNGSTLDVTGAVTFAPDETIALTMADDKIVVSYSHNGISKQAEQAITVEEKVLVDIRVDGTPNKTEYTDGDSFDSEGLTFTAIYNDGSEEILTAGDVTITPDPLTEGTTSVTVSYKENDITVEAQVTGLTVLIKDNGDDNKPGTDSNGSGSQMNNSTGNSGGSQLTSVVKKTVNKVSNSVKTGDISRVLFILYGGAALLSLAVIVLIILKKRKKAVMEIEGNIKNEEK